MLGLFSGGSLAYEAITILGQRRRDLRPRRGGVHAGPPAPDGRPRGPQADAPRGRRRLHPARRRARPRLASRPRGRAGAGAGEARRAGDRARVRHAGRPAGRAPAGGDAARGRRDRRADERAPPRGPWREDRDAHVLREAARRRRARRRGVRGADAARPRRRAVRARARGRDAVPADARAAQPRPPRPDRRAVRRAHPGDAADLRRGPAARRLRHRPHAGLPVGQRGARAARRGRDRPRAAHRPSRRRLHVAVADRVPGPLDPRARPRRLRLTSRGSSGCKRDFGVTAGPRLQRRRPAPLPAAARSRRARAARAGSRASRIASPC